MQFCVITLFPALLEAVKGCGVVGRAFERGLASLLCINPRDFTQDKYQTVDDRPYGGGPGMVMLAEPLFQAIQFAKQALPNAKVIFLSPKGTPLTQSKLRELSNQSELILLSGRYEGVDQRLIDEVVDEEISIGDYVLSGGELPAMVVIDGITRLLPDVLGHHDSAQQDSFSGAWLDCPHYTRPETWHGQVVPKVLLSGDHKAIEAWRVDQSKAITAQKRPDLIKDKNRF